MFPEPLRPVPTPQPERPTPTPVPVPTPTPIPLPTPQPTPVPTPTPTPTPIPTPTPTPTPIPIPTPTPTPTPVPIPTPTPIPMPTPQPTPVPLEPPAPRPLQMGAIAAAIRGAGCTAAAVEERSRGTVTVHGAAGQGPAERALREAVESAAPGAPIDWQVIAVDGPYCGLLDVIRPVLRGAGPGVALSIPGARPVMQRGELIIPRANLPEFPSHLQLDYASSDGSLLHMHQASLGAAYPANASPVFGQPEPPRFKGWEVADPFGTDIIVAIASSIPLFRTPRPASDTIDAYVKELRTAVENAMRGGARLSATVLVLRTADRR